MGKTAHGVFILFLAVVTLATVAFFGVRGASYYLLPQQERAFNPQHNALRPGGRVGHGLGVVGTALIVSGVALYSSRKRFRPFESLGPVKHYLEFHIFLCSLGPLLVVYHTTFKIGGLVAVSFWSMVAVATSGLVGRYFYQQVPRGIQGNEVSVNELLEQNNLLANRLREGSLLTDADLKRIDELGVPPQPASSMSFADILKFFVVSDLMRRRRVHRLFERFSKRGVHPEAVRYLRDLANRRLVLTRRIAFLEQLRRVFYYWHVIHLPFSIIMFIILAVHIGVAVTFGYTWLW
jgi:hypothetical protein